MRYGILSDIHSNLEALDAVIHVLARFRVEKIVCAGDIVGYGASPKPCISLLRKLNAVSIAGNHDWAVSGKLDASYFPEDGQEAILLNRNSLSLEDIEYLHHLDLTYQNDFFQMVHGVLSVPARFSYLDSLTKVNEMFDVMEQQICFVGHTHIPQVYVKQANEVFSIFAQEFELKPDCSYIINVGSVGQPRDGNSSASFCIYDTDLQIVEFKRIAYDVASAQKKMIQSGYPDFLSKRLSVGQ